MKKIYIILILAVGALVSSCTKEPMTGGEVPAGMIAIDLSGAAGTPQGVQTRADVQTENEKRITSAHVYFYGADNKLVKTIEANQDGVTISESRVVIPAVLLDITKKYKMVVLANQAAVTGVGDISNFDNLVSTIAAQIKAPTAATNTLAMSGITAEHDFLVNPIAPVTLVRQAVKLNVKVKLNPTFTAAFPGAVFGTVDTGEPTVSVGNVPTASFVLRRGTPVRPTPNSFIDYHNLAMDVAGAVWNVTAYAHENPTTGTDDKSKANATYFILQLPYQLKDGQVVTDNYYKVYINDPATPANPHQTIANTIYNVDISVNGFGSTVPAIEGTQVTTTVLPWGETIDQTDPVGEFLRVTETTKSLKYNFKETVNLVASDLSKVTISSKSGKIDWTRTDGVISVWVKDANTSDDPVVGIDELIIKLGQFTHTVKIDYRPSMAQLFAKGMLVSDGGRGIKIGAPNAPHKDILIFKWGTYIGMRTCNAVGTPLSIAQIVYNPTIHNPTDPSKLTPRHPNTTTEATHIGKDKDFLGYLHSDVGLNGQGYGDPCRKMGVFDGKYWRTPTGAEWQELLNESTKQTNGSLGKAVGFNGYVPRQSGTSEAMPANTDYGWFFGPNAQTQTNANASNPAKGSVFIYQRYYSASSSGSVSSMFTQDIMTSSAESSTNFNYYTANDVGGGIKSQTIALHSFAVRCIRDLSK